MKRLVSLLTAIFLLGGACSSGHSAAGPASQGEGEASAAGAASPLARGGDWRTNFSKASVKPDELVQGQIKDDIPAISSPEFSRVADVHFLADREPVIAFEVGEDVRAYPLQILIWHEIVNDVVGGKPVLITFCPLCNTAIAFDREVDGRAFDFGVSGYLRNSDLVMYDRETESWWQQITGEAIVGDLVGTRLELLPAAIVAWSDFRDAFPEAKVLNRKEGLRPYGRNPYTGYDDIDSSPFLFKGATDRRLSPMERVVTVENEGETAAYPFSRLASARVARDRVGNQEIVIFFKPGTLSPLDKAAISDSKDIGSVAVFSPTSRGQRLTFRSNGSAFLDDQTGSRWDIFGRAISGPLKGDILSPIVSGNHFWFAWVVFKPDTRVWSP